MRGKLVAIVLFCTAISGCSGAIYRQRALTGAEPIAISVDARQRVLLSQLSKDRPTDPTYRRFCAEPSPDVFTVLGVSASGSGNLNLGGASPKDVSAALQAAFASSETGATIARTQTVTMLRDMMFRTCERYLSGAISSDEFPIIAARDQRIMVSILAIEQLTGSITPRALAITSGGNASTGYNPVEVVKLLTAAQAEVKAAEEDLGAKTKKLTDADVPAGNCAALRKKKADGTPALTADETTKLATCDAAQTAVTTSTATRDREQAEYDELVRASRSGLGVSTASATGKLEFADEKARSDSIIAVALSVEKIVGSTFAQDETQLFCIRSLVRRVAGDPLYDQCVRYLMFKVAADQEALADQYGIARTTFDTAVSAGINLARERQLLAFKIQVCLSRTDEAAAFKDALGSGANALVEKAKRSRTEVENYLFDQGPAYELTVSQALTANCSLGG